LHPRYQSLLPFVITDGQKNTFNIVLEYPGLNICLCRNRKAKTAFVITKGIVFVLDLIAKKSYFRV
jgi:hypothetical protein